MRVNGLIPARFLVLIAHIIITVTIFISRDLHVKAALSTGYTTAEYNTEDQKFIIVLAVSCFLFAFEMLSFLFGVTMFLPTQSLFSIVIHCGGTVSSCYFVLWAWSYDRFWAIFGATILLPALLDLIQVVERSLRKQL